MPKVTAGGLFLQLRLPVGDNRERRDTVLLGRVHKKALPVCGDIPRSGHVAAEREILYLEQRFGCAHLERRAGMTSTAIIFVSGDG